MIYRIPQLFTILTLLLLPILTFAAESYPAKVIGITDGDTLKVLTSQKKQVKIRLAEIDTPERKQPWGNKAKQSLSDLTFQKMVTVQPVTTDRYGRLVAHILVDGLNVNRELVRTGNAWVYRKYMRDETLLDVEAEARNAKRGLWGLPEFQRIPPWEWRRKK
ncbi:MAG: thermonuclease family protein [Candidatus Thiodiazotropha sp. (ex Lucina pensylvanica)]|nr:thermonuclease family protein [Candidatus Thiodiazotropha sp. (ex Lucina pensylvanica)]